MIETRQGNLLEADVEALVNTVNCVGVMGRGIALQFRRAFPANYEAYKAACERDEVQLGKMYVVELHQLHNPRLIINFPTKQHWRSKSRLEDIETGLADLVEVVRKHTIRSLAIPPLGSGLGGLAWDDVRPLILEAVGQLENVNVIVYEPLPDTAEGKLEAPNHRQSAPPHMTPGRAALLKLMGSYLAAFMDTSITLLEIHKLAYLMQEAGEPLRLRLTEAFYGPYAENLRHVLHALEGHYINGYAGEDNPETSIELKEGALEQAEAFLADNADTQQRALRVASLIQGFATPFGMELLATVHWVATRRQVESLKDVYRHVYAWNNRKSMFTEKQIETALNTLLQEGWLSQLQLPYVEVH